MASSAPAVNGQAAENGGPAESALTLKSANTASLARLNHLCATLRDGLGKSLELKKTSTGAHARTALFEGSPALLELREVNRSVWEQVASLKARSAAANQEVDATDLKLQNLQYEKNYFLREVY